MWSIYEEIRKEHTCESRDCRLDKEMIEIESEEKGAQGDYGAIMRHFS